MIGCKVCGTPWAAKEYGASVPQVTLHQQEGNDRGLIPLGLVVLRSLIQVCQ